MPNKKQQVPNSIILLVLRKHFSITHNKQVQHPLKNQNPLLYKSNLLFKAKKKRDQWPLNLNCVIISGLL